MPWRRTMVQAGKKNLMFSIPFLMTARFGYKQRKIYHPKTELWSKMLNLFFHIVSQFMIQ
eukprot:8400843-Karenia_brevis.AAC.1